MLLWLTLTVNWQNFKRGRTHCLVNLTHPQQRQILLLKHDPLVQFKIHFIWEEVHASVQINFTTHLPRIDEVVYIVSLKAVHPVHQVEETTNIDRDCGVLASSLT